MASPWMQSSATRHNAREVKGLTARPSSPWRWSEFYNFINSGSFCRWKGRGLRRFDVANRRKERGGDGGVYIKVCQDCILAVLAGDLSSLQPLTPPCSIITAGKGPAAAAAAARREQPNHCPSTASKKVEWHMRQSQSFPQALHEPSKTRETHGAGLQRIRRTLTFHSP